MRDVFRSTSSHLRVKQVNALDTDEILERRTQTFRGCRYYAIMNLLEYTRLGAYAKWEMLDDFLENSGTNEIKEIGFLEILYAVLQPHFKVKIGPSKIQIDADLIYDITPLDEHLNVEEILNLHKSYTIGGLIGLSTRKFDVSGLHWESISAAPSDGTEIVNEELRNQLLVKTDFTEDEWAEFGIKLESMSYIKVGSNFYTCTRISRHMVCFVKFYDEFVVINSWRGGDVSKERDKSVYEVECIEAASKKLGDLEVECSSTKEELKKNIREISDRSLGSANKFIVSNEELMKVGEKVIALTLLTGEQVKKWREDGPHLYAMKGESNYTTYWKKRNHEVYWYDPVLEKSVLLRRHEYPSSEEFKTWVSKPLPPPPPPPR